MMFEGVIEKEILHGHLFCGIGGGAIGFNRGQARELYRHFAAHPKASTNPNFDAKLRQQLQRGPYRRVGRGEWAARS